MKTNLLIPGVALAIGLGVGFGIGNSGENAQAPESTTETNSRTRADSRPTADRDESGRETKARTIDEIYSKPGQSNRVQALLDLYASLGPDEFAAEAEKLDALPFNERILASVLLFGKWAEVDPTAAMAFTDTMGFAGAFVRPTASKAGRAPIR